MKSLFLKIFLSFWLVVALLVVMAILITVATTRTGHLLDKGVAKQSAMTNGFSLAFWVAAGFAAVALVTTLVVLKREDLAQTELAPSPSA